MLPGRSDDMFEINRALLHFIMSSKEKSTEGKAQIRDIKIKICMVIYPVRRQELEEMQSESNSTET